MKPIFGVTFCADVPIDLSAFKPLMIPTPVGLCPAIRCSEVQETAFGFLQLTTMLGEKNLAMTLFVPPSYVLYMVRAESESTLGFLPGAAQAPARSDPTA